MGLCSGVSVICHGVWFIVVLIMNCVFDKIFIWVCDFVGYFIIFIKGDFVIVNFYKLLYL